MFGRWITIGFGLGLLACGAANAAPETPHPDSNTELSGRDNVNHGARAVARPRSPSEEFATLTAMFGLDRADGIRSLRAERFDDPEVERTRAACLAAAESVEGVPNQEEGRRCVAGLVRLEELHGNAGPSAEPILSLER